jgi:hypothetical protein
MNALYLILLDTPRLEVLIERSQINLLRKSRFMLRMQIPVALSNLPTKLTNIHHFNSIDGRQNFTYAIGTYLPIWSPLIASSIFRVRYIDAAIDDSVSNMNTRRTELSSQGLR